MAVELKDDGDWVPATPAKTVKEYSSVDSGKERDTGDGMLGDLSATDACFAGVSESPGFKASLGLNGGISDNFGSDRTTSKASDAPGHPNSEKLDSGENKKRKPKMKKHWPKIFDETKPRKTRKSPVNPSTPKQKTPRRSIPKTSPLEKRKCMRKEKSSEVFDGNLEIPSKSCRRKLFFNLENNARDRNGDAVDQTSYCVVKGFAESMDVYTETSVRDSFEDKVGTKFSGLKVYQRIFRPNECLKNSRKLGPNFPTMFKKKRRKQQRATKFQETIHPFIGHKVTSTKRSYPSTELADGVINNELLTNLRVIQPSQRQISAAIADPKSFSCVWSLCPMTTFRKKRSMTHRKNHFRGVEDEIKHPEPLTWSVQHKRKRSKISSRRRDLSSLCLGQTTFPLKALTVVTEDTGQENVEDWAHNLVETPIFVGQHLDIKHMFSNLNVDEVQGITNFISQMFERLCISDADNQLVVLDKKNSGSILPYEGKFDPKKKLKLVPKVDLDAETMRVWTLMMKTDRIEDIGEGDHENKINWDNIREMYRGRMESFISCMHHIQGNRQFSPWKGSVVDSVIGVFLTQNVSDHLSSSAFMSLVAKFPPKRSNSCKNNVGHEEYVNNESCHQESVDNEKVCLSSTEQDMRQSITDMKYGDRSSIFRKTLLVEEDTFLQQYCNLPTIGKNSEFAGERNKRQAKEKQENPINWDDLRKEYSRGRSKDLVNDDIDSADWEGVRQASVQEVAKVIMDRGMNNILANRIKDFLDRLIQDHGIIDLEWLRDVPPDKAKDYLLSIPGLGLKSTECVRLLTLRHHAFPVDTNVGRILVRLGWVPLYPLPEDVQIHDLNNYPLVDNIQKYIWPRLCKLSSETLYECHYQMITFGKVFCTKRQPNCNACPMRGQCRHFASAYASARFVLTGVQGGSNEYEQVKSSQNVMDTNTPMSVHSNDDLSRVGDIYFNSEPIVEFPPSPEPASREMAEHDIEDFGYESEDEIIPTIKLNQEEFTMNLLDFMEKTNFLNGKGTTSKELVALSTEAASIPMPKLKFISRLRTEHQVYEVPDSHPLLAGFDEREPDDPCPYLLSIWPNENAHSSQPPKGACGCQESITCDVGTCCLRDEVQKENEEFIQGTILIPCRTANRGSFPLNGTYFQVNEVFADHETSRKPIPVPRKWIWNWRRRSLYCGTSTTSIFRGMTTYEVQSCFWKGFICVRATDRVTKAPRPLSRRFHICKSRQVGDE